MTGNAEDGVAPEIQILVFFGAHRDLADAVPKAVEQNPGTRFVCILGRNDDSSKVRWFWNAQVGPRFPHAALLVVRVEQDEIPTTLTHLASVVREQQPGIPIRLSLLLGTPGHFWSGVRQSRWLRQLEKGLGKCVPDCRVERFA